MVTFWCLGSLWLCVIVVGPSGGRVVMLFLVLLMLFLLLLWLLLVVVVLWLFMVNFW